MKKSVFLTAVCMIFAVFVVFVPIASADDEGDLNAEAVGLDKEGGKPDVQGMVTKKMEQRYNVTPGQMDGLRSRKMGYGEMTVVFSLAKGMPGGITDENISKILSLREGPPKAGWGRVAKEMGVKLGPVVSDLKSMRKEMRAEFGKMKRERVKKTNNDHGMQRREKMDKPPREKPEMGR